MWQVARASHFLVESLPHAAATLDMHMLGPVFQALLLRAGLGRCSSAAATTADLEHVFGKGKADKLAAAAREVCDLLRVKIEDDGDLRLAMTVLQDCERFLRGLAIVAERRGTQSFALLQELLKVT
mmetsp:Transcript_63697/g.141835  ORF Transcript_63697/g.141835 Transcript_63697/m.141835 type:complete len:126 (+) Transcript_63697:1038-1415(+)